MAVFATKVAFFGYGYAAAINHALPLNKSLSSRLSEEYAQSNITVNVTVNKDNTRIDACKNVVTVYNSDESLVVSLLDGFNRPVSGVGIFC